MQLYCTCTGATRTDAIVPLDFAEAPGICSFMLTLGSLLMVLATLPFSLLYTVKVVQELENDELDFPANVKLNQ